MPLCRDTPLQHYCFYMNWSLSEFLNPRRNVVDRWECIAELELLVDASDLHLNLLCVAALEVIYKAGYNLVNDLKGGNAQKIQMEIGGINKKFKLGYTRPSVNDVAAWIEKLG